MSRRKERIINFFSGLLTNVDEINFDKVVQESLALFEEITHIMQNGTKEEQEEVQGAMETVNKKVTEQFDTLCEEFGVSKEEVKNLISDPSNFSPEIFDVMKKLQAQVEPTKIEEVTSKKAKRKPKQWVSA